MTENDQIIAALRQALAASPDNVPLRQHLADLLLAQGEFQQAEQEYRQVLASTPDDAQVKFALARAFYGQEKWMVALVVLEELIKSGDPPAQALLLAARAYLRTAQKEQAAQAYHQALSKDPDLADAELASQLGPASAAGEDEDADGRVRLLVDEAAPVLNTAVEQSSISFKDVGGMDELKEEIRVKIIHPLEHPEIYRAYNKSVGGGILMYGPPGCGKTHLARATAGEVNAYFLPVGIHDVLDLYLGQSERNLHELFELARRYKPCVLFIDEVDALGASRTDMRRSAGRQQINQLLAEMDGINASNAGVLILAATNAPWHMDPALRRPGRFDRVIFVPPPDRQARAAILKIMLADKPTANIDYARLAQGSAGLSGADLKGVVDVAVEDKLRQAIKEGAPSPLTTKDLLRARKKMRPSTKDWFATARNYALYSNQSGLYDDVLSYLKLNEDSDLLSRMAFWRNE